MGVGMVKLYISCSCYLIRSNEFHEVKRYLLHKILRLMNKLLYDGF